MLESILRHLDDLVEADFAGELVAETMLAAHGNHAFARTLRQGADEFRALVAELYGPEGTDKPEALARAASGGGGGDCTCCASTPSGTSCRPCSCWIIVVIIIIIVVSK